MTEVSEQSGDVVFWIDDSVISCCGEQLSMRRRRTALAPVQQGLYSIAVPAHAAGYFGGMQELIKQDLPKADTLELAFDSKSLRTICEKETQAKLKLGSRVAEILKHRLADLCAATSPKDLIAGRPREGSDLQSMIIDLCDGYQMVFSANHPKNPMTEAGKIDWPKVSRIKVLSIESRHA